RDRDPNEKTAVPRTQFVDQVSQTLDEMQLNLFRRAQMFRDRYLRAIDSADEFKSFFTPKNAEQPEIHGGFALAHFSGEPELEAKMKDELGVTVRCIPLKGQVEGADAEH